MSPGLTFLLAIFCVFGAHAQNETFTISPQQSLIAFTLGDVLHTVHGTFHLQSGSVEFDRSSGLISGEILVATGSGNSGNTIRDNRMSKDILDAPEFGVASFSPERLQGTISTVGDSNVQVAGTFMLHGISHELIVPIQIHLDGLHCIAKAQFLVPYVEWGLKDPSTFVLRVSKEVEIYLVLVGTVSPIAAK
jgi:polyisoprenoid-binding protein YceI